MPTRGARKTTRRTSEPPHHVVGFLGLLVFTVAVIRVSLQYAQLGQPRAKWDRHNVLYAVSSLPTDTLLRNVIRKTWGSHIGRNSQLLFFVTNEQSPEILEDLQEEIQVFRDIVYFENLIESNINRTLKSLAIFDYAAHLPHFDYLMKVDSDVYVKPYALQLILDELPAEGVYLGRMEQYAWSKIVRDEDQLIPGFPMSFIDEQEYPHVNFPARCRAPAYLLSKDLFHSVRDCLPKDLSCTESEFWGTCEYSETCLFPALRFEDTTIGGIVTAALNDGNPLDLDCVSDACVQQVRARVDDLVVNSPKFIIRPWGAGLRPDECDDDFIAFRGMSIRAMWGYYKGGEGRVLPACDLGPAERSPVEIAQTPTTIAIKGHQGSSGRFKGRSGSNKSEDGALV